MVTNLYGPFSDVFVFFHSSACTPAASIWQLSPHLPTQLVSIAGAASLKVQRACRPGSFPSCVSSLITSVTSGCTSTMPSVSARYNPPHFVTRLTASFFSRIRHHPLKLSPPKSGIGATTVDFPGHTISSNGLQPSADSIYALVGMPMPKDTKQLRSMLGVLSYSVPGTASFSSKAPPILPSSD